MPKVVVGMSGGVDSSVVALLLKRAGYDVIGLFMKNWEDEGPCPAEEDFKDVVAIAGHLQIPFYSVNFAKEYWDRVFSICLKQYEAGFTPNPDILCNREIKFDLFYKKALELGADFVATGHYAKTEDGYLLKGDDPDKDQSYFLYTLKEEILQKVLFPIGAMKKTDVRQIAESAELATAKKKDSTGICFIGKRDFRDFLSNYIPRNPGAFETLSGKVVGQHQGIAYYTIGQRKGLNIGGPGEAWFVVAKDVARNVIFVEQGEDHPALYSKTLFAQDVSWVKDIPKLPLRCKAKIRYRSADADCLVEEGEEGLKVTFDVPQKAVTPYQSIVFYDGSICLGGGLIKNH